MFEALLLRRQWNTNSRGMAMLNRSTPWKNCRDPWTNTLLKMHAANSCIYTDTNGLLYTDQPLVSQVRVLGQAVKSYTFNPRPIISAKTARYAAILMPRHWVGQIVTQGCRYPRTHNERDRQIQYTPKKSSHSVYVELALYVSTVTVFTPFHNRFLETCRSMYRSTNSHF